MYSIHLEKSTAHAVSPVRKTRLLYFDRRRGVWLQNRSWDAAQAGRHALDRQGRQRHHRPSLQQAQRTLPGFLGTPLRAKAGGCMTSLNLMCARVAPPGRESLNTQFSRSWAAAATTDGMSGHLPTPIPGSAYGGSWGRFFAWLKVVVLVDALVRIPVSRGTNLHLLAANRPCRVSMYRRTPGPRGSSIR